MRGTIQYKELEADCISQKNKVDSLVPMTNTQRQKIELLVTVAHRTTHQDSLIAQAFGRHSLSIFCPSVAEHLESLMRTMMDVHRQCNSLVIPTERKHVTELVITQLY